ncbi:MAG: 4-alpha-glucanotransferase [Candidatus Eremiobacteraeota bacterium]|nr:4-alpha-glucanotransferase [Candidatus Eremiobacteraeota bacterium]
MVKASLDELAERAGIEPSFTDYFGKERPVGDDTKRALIDAIGIAPDDGMAAITLVRGQALQEFLPGARSWEIVLESGEHFAGDTRELPLGYHRLAARIGGTETTCALIGVPAECYIPPDLRDGHCWALSTQLYALRSERNWGIGDFTDLANLARVAGERGAGAIALNPLHELHPSNPHACSPYSPTSRFFLNGMFVDCSAVAADRPDEVSLRDLRDAELVDYAGVAHVKRTALETSFARFRREHLERAGDARAAAFRAFRRERGASLERLARYEALTEHFRTRDERSYGWMQWPEEYRSPSSPAVERFARDRRDRVEFFAYVQWLADEQLAEAAAVARAGGVGLYRDLAVGVDLNSADAWADQETVVAAVSLGAPPDQLNALGQKWGLPPFSPWALQRKAYAPFAELLRANMRHATILRIDHVLALRRGFWIPRDGKPAEGAYVRYPFEQLLGVLALESVRNRCMVVGEDLGTVPEGFRERLRSLRALSSRLVYFERNFSDGAFDPPQRYPRLAAASVGTHDLPPLAGWWTGDDIALRARIGLYPDDGAHPEAVQERRHARFMLVLAMEQAGCVDAATAARLRGDAERGGTLDVFDDLVRGVHRFLAATPSLLKVVALEDVLGEVDAINVPGTTDQHPNWQRKHAKTVESLAGNERLATLASILGRTRGTAT